MLTAYRQIDGALESLPSGTLPGALWYDLHEPSQAEERAVEHALAIEVPTREEMREVESSSALYREQDATFVTLRVVVRSPGTQPRLASITLVLARGVFITVRYADTKPFQQFIAQTAKAGAGIFTAPALMLSLLEAVVDRAADTLEEIGDSLDPISQEIFSQNAASMQTIAAADLGRVLKNIGQSGDLTSRIRESLHTVRRAIPFLQMEHFDADLNGRLDTLNRDVQSLLEHDNFLQTQIQFLLDSNLGLISIQQNAIMKILSIGATVFLPPTLIGAIYGMNFDKLPELHWRYGYPFALLLMAGSAVGPLLYFRAKRWL